MGRIADPYDPMNLTPILFATEFTREETDLLWSLGVDMDDWDYCFMFPPDILREEKVIEQETEWEWFPFVKEKDRVWPKEQVSEISWRYLDAPYDKGHYVQKDVERTYWRCDDWTIDGLLRGCCSNRWYLIEWNGEKKAIGLAYHA